MPRYGRGRSGARVAAAGLILPLLAACSLAPAYDRPALPTSDRYPGAAEAAATERAGRARVGWREFFADPALRELIGRALENNRDLRSAARRTEAVRALYGIARADRLPTIAAGAAGSRSRAPADLSFTGRAATAAQYQANLQVSSWELDLWGRVRDLKEAALEAYLADDETRRSVAVSLVAGVANSYLLERELEERLALAGSTLASREESLRIVSRRFQRGNASRLDEVQAETLLNQARAALAVLRRARDLNRNALTLAVGAPVALEPLPLSRVEEGFAPDLPPGLPSDLLAGRPDVRAAEHRLKGAHADIGAARAAFFPRIALTGAFGTASAELDGLFGAGSGAWTFAPSATVPLFDHGRRRAALDLARARRDQAVADYERIVQGAFREVADGLAERRWLAEQVAAERAVVSLQTERARLARLRWENGSASYLEALDAERERFAAEQAHVQTRRALLASKVDLFAALGGGDTAEEPKR